MRLARFMLGPGLLAVPLWLIGCGGGEPTGAPDAALPPDAMPLPDGRPDATPLPACRDVRDDDGDLLIDFPNDPGCDSPEDTDETDDCPTGPTCPECANGIDDDGDGDIDAADLGCAYAGDTDEFNSSLPVCGPSVSVTDITAPATGSGTFVAGEPNEIESPTCGGLGAERAFTYTVLEGPATLTISTDHSYTTVDTVVYVRTECQQPTTEIGCDDDGGTAFPGTSVLTLTGVEVGSYFIIVDSFGPGSLGDFVVTVTATVP